MRVVKVSRVAGDARDARPPLREKSPYVRHTEVAVAAEMDESSEYSSDEDDPGCASD